MIPAFVCYAGSFFWLGLMWISSYQAWQHVDQVSAWTLFYMLLSLFASSFFPFATSLVQEQFSALPAQAFYRIIALVITLCSILLTCSINQDHRTPVMGILFMVSKKIIVIDTSIKVLSLLLCLMVWPPFMTISVWGAVGTLLFHLLHNPKMTGGQTIG